MVGILGKPVPLREVSERVTTESIEGPFQLNPGEEARGVQSADQTVEVSPEGRNRETSELLPWLVI